MKRSDGRSGHQVFVSHLSVILRLRDIAAARKFFTTAIAGHGEPEEIVTDRAAALANVVEELLPQA